MGKLNYAIVLQLILILANILLAKSDTELPVGSTTEIFDSANSSSTTPISTTSQKYPANSTTCANLQEFFGNENFFEKFAFSYLKPHLMYQEEIPKQFGLRTDPRKDETPDGSRGVGVVPILFSPIDLTQILTLATDKVWELPIDDLYDVLTEGWPVMNSTRTEQFEKRGNANSYFCLDDHKKRKFIGDIYKPFFQHLHKDPTILLSSNVHTTVKDFVTPQNLIELMTFASYLNYNDSIPRNVRRSLEDINSYISRQTFGTLNRNDGLDFASRVDMTLGTGFGYFTPAIFVNTLYYQSSWPTPSPFRSIGVQSFGSDENRTTEFLETVGHFFMHEDDSVTTVRIPLQRSTESHPKYLTLIQPKTQGSPKEFNRTNDPFMSLNVEEILKSVRNSTPTLLALQVPSFNFTVQHLYRYPLRELGLGDTMCPRMIMDDIICSNSRDYATWKLACTLMARDAVSANECAQFFGYETTFCPGGLNYPEGAPCTNHNVPAMAQRQRFCQQKTRPMMLWNLVQQAHVRLDAQGFQVASATDTNLNNRVLHHLLDGLKVKKQGRPPSRVRRQASSVPFQFEEFLPRNLFDEIRLDANRRGHLGPVVVVVDAPRSEPVREEPPVTPKVELIPELTLKFDSPFLWILEDGNVGPLFMGTVTGTQREYEQVGKSDHEQLAKIQNEMNSGGSEWAKEMQTGMYWGCKYFVI